MDWNNLESLMRGRTPELMDKTGAYAVLVPLVERDGEVSVLYEVRARSLRRQPGEVCFPGGAVEGNETAEACAVRETWEELAIPPESIHILGRLDFIVHRANFLMQPVLARLDASALEAMRPNPQEVEEVFTVPLSHLLHTKPLEYQYQLIPKTGENFPYELLGIPRDYRWQNGGENVPVYPWEGRAIWGLTGRITRHLVSLLKGE